MIRTEIIAHVNDIIVRVGLSTDQTLSLLKERVGGAPIEQLLAVTLEILRDKTERVAEPEGELFVLDDGLDMIQANRIELDDRCQALANRVEALLRALP